MFIVLVWLVHALSAEVEGVWCLGLGSLAFKAWGLVRSLRV